MAYRWLSPDSGGGAGRDESQAANVPLAIQGGLAMEALWRSSAPSPSRFMEIIAFTLIVMGHILGVTTVYRNTTLFEATRPSIAIGRNDFSK